MLTPQISGHLSVASSCFQYPYRCPTPDIIALGDRSKDRWRAYHHFSRARIAPLAIGDPFDLGSNHIDKRRSFFGAFPCLLIRIRASSSAQLPCCRQNAWRKTCTALAYTSVLESCTIYSREIYTGPDRIGGESIILPHIQVQQFTWEFRSTRTRSSLTIRLCLAAIPFVSDAGGPNNGGSSVSIRSVSPTLSRAPGPPIGMRLRAIVKNTRNICARHLAMTKRSPLSSRPCRVQAMRPNRPGTNQV
ncbi:hypothetical protein C8R47DRAFT_571745 [Mycena vitilis]|nr:hypothetical protein C8R47DRAFT_571745 [Mycena vitilis]